MTTGSGWRLVSFSISGFMLNKISLIDLLKSFGRTKRWFGMSRLMSVMDRTFFCFFF